MKPFHTHDCDECILLGKLETEERKYDLYLCEADPVMSSGHDTLIARYSSDGPDYISCSVSMCNPTPPMIIAKILYGSHRNDVLKSIATKER